MSSTYIRSADETHQVHVTYSQKQFGRIWGRLAFGTVHAGLPVVDCPDLDAWLDAQHAELKRQYEAVMAGVAASRAQPMQVAA